jgi:2,4-dienoyl-CoA reductase-like NADH-dependent reductase (Old Yellow Enzyme family)
MYTGKASSEGHVTEELIEHYVERASNLGLQIVEAAGISQTAIAFSRMIRIDSDDFIHGLEKLVKRVHQRGTPIALQLAHAGGAYTSRELLGCQPLAPSAVMIPGKGREVPRAMTYDEIEEVINDFSEAGRRAYEAGFDAVEIHGAHATLLSQFLSPITNRRDDECGGSLENRTRISVRVIDGIRKELGEYPILYRLGAEDMLPGGLNLEDGVRAAKMIADAGADIIDVSGGLYGHIHPENNGPGYYVPQAIAVKKAVGVPVIGVGGIKTPEEADEIIRSGKVDLVAIGRAILNDRNWALKAVESLSK